MPLRRDGAHLVVESERRSTSCAIRERWSLMGTDGGLIGDYFIIEPDECPDACNRHWRLGRNISQLRF